MACSISAVKAESSVAGVKVRFGFPAFSRNSSCTATMRLMAAWPSWRACSISSSLTSWAPHSTITSASAVPAISRFSRLRVRKSVEDGLTTNWPSQRPTRTAPIALSKGMSEMYSAVEAPMIESVSESFSRSADRSRPMTCVSQL